MQSRAIIGLAFAGLATAALLNPAEAQSKLELKASDVHPAGYPTVVAVENFGKKLEQATGGRITVKMFPSMQLGGARIIDIASLGRYPLLLLDSGYSVRKMFDAACRLAEVEPNILLESRAPHTLLALAEAGRGVAIIPSILTADRYDLRIVRVAFRQKLLRERLIIQWDKRRPIPSYAESFCGQLAEYMRKIFPITRPSMADHTLTERKGALGKAQKHTRKANLRMSA